MAFELLPETASKDTLVCSDPTIPSDDSNLVIKLSGLSVSVSESVRISVYDYVMTKFFLCLSGRAGSNSSSNCLKGMVDCTQVPADARVHKVSIILQQRHTKHQHPISLALLAALSYATVQCLTAGSVAAAWWVSAGDVASPASGPLP